MPQSETPPPRSRPPTLLSPKGKSRAVRRFLTSYVCCTQYLFDIPAGFSRLVLEHQCRPGLGLRAAFLSGAHDRAVVRLPSRAGPDA